jgi:hypothetical protein
VPLAGATAGQSHVRVSVGKEQFKDAPRVEPDAELTTGNETDAYDYYGLEYRAVGQDARRLAKH